MNGCGYGYILHFKNRTRNKNRISAASLTFLVLTYP